MEKKIVLATLSLLPLSTMSVDANSIGVVTASTLNVRSGPGQNYNRIFTLSKDEKVTIKSSSNGWYKIVNSKNREGWASSQYIKASEDTSVYDKKIVSVDRLNMRSGPSTSYRVLKILTKGTEVEIISTSGDWSKVKCSGTTGYVKNEYLSNPSSNENNSTAIKYVKATSLNVRSGPSTSYSILGKLKLNDKVEVLGETSTWSKINYNGKVAYVSSEFLSDSKSDTNGENSTEVKPTTVTKYVKATSLNVRSGPSTSYSILGKLKLNDKVEVLGETSTWSKINYNGNTAYVSSEYLSDSVIDSGSDNSTEVRPTIQNKKVTSNTLNVRSGPGTSYTKIGVLYKGNVVKGISEKNGWIEINYNNQTGYISSDYVVNTSESESSSSVNSSGGGASSISSSYVNLTYSLSQHVDLQYNKALKGGNVIDASISTGSGSGFINATRADLEKYLNPDNFTGTQKGLNQFLKIDSYKGGVTAEELNTYLNKLKPDSTGNNVFYNKGQAFIDAAKNSNIDLAYLVSHAMVETAYGRSQLAMGQEVNGVTVYNFFGIGAYDGTALVSGKNYAYKMGWTSVEKTLEGSAQWIANNYIKSSYNQNTLYKMRWSYESSNHQYATDVNWANLIASVMTNITSMYDGSALSYEIPRYK